MPNFEKIQLTVLNDKVDVMNYLQSKMLVKEFFETIIIKDSFEDLHLVQIIIIWNSIDSITKYTLRENGKEVSYNRYIDLVNHIEAMYMED